MFIGSKRFFYGVIALFLFSSLWIAFSGKYPLAFDENYHYGIVKAYANQFSPFFKHPPANSEAFGDITRYPSYLFHYLMSFPYRVISLFTESDPIKIIFLRIINVFLLSSSLIVFKKIFEKLKIGAATGNLALLFFVLTPVVPFLGAHINYDNLLIPLTGVVILLAVQVIEELKKGRLNVKYSLLLLITCLFTSLVKYTFLPVFAALGLAGAFVLIRESMSGRVHVWKQVKPGFAQINLLTRITLIAGLIVGVGLFIERYGLNIVNYHTPAPDCGQVLTVDSCLHYGPWARDYYLQLGKTGPPTWGAVRYSGHWAAQSMHELFFAIDQNYHEKSPLPLPYYGAWLFGAVGTVLFVINWKKIKRLAHVHLILFTVISYVFVLWIDNYHRFTTVNWPVAIHGRYLLPLLPLLYALLAYAYKVSFSNFKWAVEIKALLTIVAVLCMLQGGLVTYIIRSSDSWYWNNEVVVRINHVIRGLVGTITIN